MSHFLDNRPENETFRLDPLIHVCGAALPSQYSIWRGIYPTSDNVGYIPHRLHMVMTMTFDPMAHPRSGNGQFSEKLGSDPEVGLAYSEGGNGFPAPQADRLDKVAVAVDAVAAGCETPDSIAESLGMTQSRNGHMYGDAAGYLGLVEVINENPKHYGLTPLGEQFIDMEPDQRSAMLNTLVADTDIVQTYNDRGDDGVEELLEERGYSGETVSRRAQTAASWAKHVEGAERLDLTTEINATRERAVEAAKKVESKRQPAAPVTCMVCFTEKSVTGACMCPPD